MFWTRLISGIILVLLSTGILYFGGTVTGVALCLLSLCGIFELCRVWKIEKKAPAIASGIWTILYYGVLLIWQGRNYVTACLVLYMLVVLSIYVLAFPRYRDTDIMAAFFSFYYVSVMLSYVYRIRIMRNGGYFVVLVFICSWGNDTLAYCAGRLFGKHKMTPALSPKKSVEGLVGGIAGAGLLGFLYGLFLEGRIEPGHVLRWQCALIGAVGAIPAVIGDLAASAVKRNHDMKDYGKLIPGHGGVMDRFDSMIFTAPIIYNLLLLIR